MSRGTAVSFMKLPLLRFAKCWNPWIYTSSIVRDISGRNWHARTPKVTPRNSLFFALCLPKIYNPRRCTFEEATDSESQKISSDLLIVCWRKRGFIVFAGRANICHFFLCRRDKVILQYTTTDRTPSEIYAKGI